MCGQNEVIFCFLLSLSHSVSVDDSKSFELQVPAKKFGLFKNILTKHLNRFKPKKDEEQLEDEELICAYSPEETNQAEKQNQQDPSQDSESVTKIVKGVKFKDSDNQSLNTKGSIKSNRNSFDDFGIEKCDVVSLDEFKDDDFQNELGKCFVQKQKKILRKR